MAKGKQQQNAKQPPNPKRQRYMMKRSNLPGTLCDNVSSMNAAVTALRSSSYIVCDCEGVDLGSQGGGLSIIQLAALPSEDNPDPPVFLIDAIALSDAKLQPVYKLLRSETHTKIMYDARSDWSEFYHRHGVELTHVLDLQLADIDSRTVRGETQEQQLERLPPYCSAEEIKNYRALYTMVQRLKGLGPCTVEHGVVGPDEKGKPNYFPHNKWGERPLWKKHILYAVKDIQLISKLFLLFSQKGYIDEAKLLAQSERYMSLRRDALVPANFGHPLLPLEIMDAPPARAARQACKACNRELALPCFPRKAGEEGTAQTCLVCCAVFVHEAEIRAKQEAQREKQRKKNEEKIKRDAERLSAQMLESSASSSSRARPGIGYSHGIYAERDADGSYGIFGYDDEDTPGGTYYRDMYDSD